MSRTDHYIGLSRAAEALVSSARRGEAGEHDGLCNSFPLLSFAMPDGRILHEMIQTDIWDGGPYWFTCLADAGGAIVPESRWTDQEMSDVMGFRIGEAEPRITREHEEMFEWAHPMIESGGLTLDWATQQIYERWLKRRTDAPSIS